MQGRRFWRVAALALLFCICAGPAQAHAPSATVGDFYAGLLHPLTALEHILAFIALGLLGGRQGQRAQPVVLIFSAALLSGALLALILPALPLVDLINLASAVLLGLLVAAALSMPLPLLYTIASILGLTHGFANGDAIVPPLKPWLYLPGVALSGLLVVAYGFVATDFAQRRNAGWMSIALRVIGSWIAAIGILVLGLSAKSLLSG